MYNASISQRDISISDGTLASDRFVENTLTIGRIELET